VNGEVQVNSDARKLLRQLSLQWVVVLLVSCSSGPGGLVINQGDLDAAVDTLFVNGVVFTAVADSADASVLAIRDGKIIYVGTQVPSELAAMKTIDLAGGFLMPGFIDNHVHFMEGGAGLASVDLRDAASPAEFADRIAAHAASMPQDSWMLSGNWDHHLWGGELPRKDWIDAATRDTPVLVSRLDGHMALANSVALRLAGISGDTQVPLGGEIVLDSSGTPTGILKGTALNLVLGVIPPPSEEETLQAFEAAQSMALRNGVTQVHAVTANATETTLLDAFVLALERGRMRIRAHVYTPLEHWQQAAKRVAEHGRGDEWLRWGGVKGFVDGSLGSSTAWFHEPYSHDATLRGAPLTEPHELERLLAGSHGAGLRLAVHAIGDRAIDALIEHYRMLAGDNIRSQRLRIEHFQHPTQAAIEAAAHNGLVLSMQPYHAIDDGRWAEERIGRKRAATTYAFKSVLDAGGLLSFGSDWPVAPLDPLAGVYAAVTRRTTDGAHPEGWQPQEKISVTQALIAYTRTNAYAVFEDDKSGTLELGKRADLVVLSEDPRAVDAENLRDIQVLQTIVAGAVAYDATIGAR